MNRSRRTTTLARANFTAVEEPGVEAGAWNICPTIDPAALMGPGGGAAYIYDAGVSVEEPPAVPSEWYARCDERGDLPGDSSGAMPVPQAERFQKLAMTWKSDVRFLSDVDEICSHPAYQEIIGMGVVALPFIFAELQHEPDNWFWALKAITGADPVPKAHRGDMTQMAADWLAWRQTHMAPVPLD